MKATQLLKKDHRAVNELFQKLEEAGERAMKTRARLFAKIGRELDFHTQIEEEIFYPSVREAAGEGSKAADLIRESLEEHALVKQLVSEIGGMQPDDEQYAAKCMVLQEMVEHHVEEEEHELFPMVEKLFDRRKHEELGRKLEARKGELAGEPYAQPMA